MHTTMWSKCEIGATFSTDHSQRCYLFGYVFFNALHHQMINGHRTCRLNEPMHVESDDGWKWSVESTAHKEAMEQTHYKATQLSSHRFHSWQRLKCFTATMQDTVHGEGNNAQLVQHLCTTWTSRTRVTYNTHKSGWMLSLQAVEVRVCAHGPRIFLRRW